MKKEQFVGDLKSRDQVSTQLLVKYIALAEARDGRNYLNIVLSDATGEIEGRKWSDAKGVVDEVSKGDIVELEGKINNYQNRQQLIIDKIRKVTDQNIDMDDFIVKSATPPEKMFSELMMIVDNLDDAYIRELLRSILFDGEINRRIKIWQAGKSVHHAYQSGLLEHILSCVQLSLTLSKHYQVNINYVVADAILHDICKIYELSEGPVVEYTE